MSGSMSDFSELKNTLQSLVQSNCSINVHVVVVTAAIITDCGGSVMIIIKEVHLMTITSSSLR